MAVTDDVLDEHTFRPARLSAALALAVALVAVTLLTSGEPQLRRFTGVAIVAGVFSAVTIGLAGRVGVVLRTVGASCLPLAALSFVGLAAFVVQSGAGLPHLGYTLGMYTAALGGALGAVGLDRTDAPTDSLRQVILLVTLLIPIVVVGSALHRRQAVTELHALAEDAVSGILTFVLVPPAGGPSALAFFVLCAAAGGIAYLALRALATHGRGLLTQTQRETADRLVGRLGSAFRVGVPALIIAGVIVGVAIVAGVFGTLPKPIRGILLSIAFSPGLRTMLGVIGVSGAVVWCSVRALVTLRRLSGEYVLRAVVPILGGVVSAGCIVSASLALGLVTSLRRDLRATPLAALGELLHPSLFIAVMTIAALAGFTVLVGTLVSLREFRILPPKSPGMALATGGVFLATLTAPPNLVLTAVGVAAMIVVWDSSVRAAELGEQLGRHSPTRLGELVHIGGTSVVAIAGGAIVLVLNYVATTIRPDVSPRLALLGFLAALFGTFLILAALRS